MDDATTYHHGDQEIGEQVRTYRSFGSMTKWGSLTIAVGVLMLTLWFCLGVSFFGGLIPGVILAGVGVVFLRERREPGGLH